MVICIFGESCTGKSSIVDELMKQREVIVYSGKDYLRLAKNESDAKKMFMKLLEENVHSEKTVIYIASEKEQLAFLPEGALRILVTADIEDIKERFAKRMGGHMPAPVAAMIERKHGMFDQEAYDIKLSGESIESSCEKILAIL